MAPCIPTDDLIERVLVYSIVGAFYDVYNYCGYGFCNKERRVGWHRADMIVDGKVIVECKATDAMPPYARHQILTYLNATLIEVGVLLHFRA